MSVHDFLVWPFDMDAKDSWMRGYLVGIQVMFYGRTITSAIWPDHKSKFKPSANR